MKEFAALFSALDSTTSTRKKTDALLLYFQRAQPADAAWALYFLAGGKPRQTVPTGLLRAVAREAAGIPEWLFDESYDVVGDLAETIAHVLPPAPAAIALPLHVWIEERLLALRGQAPEAISAALKGYWNELDTPGLFLLTKLIGGSFRVGVAKSLVLRALAEATGIDATRRIKASRANRIRSSSRIRCRRRWNRWAIETTGRSNGSGTASVRSSSGAARALGCGRAARICSTAAFPRSTRCTRRCRTTRCSTARSPSGATAACNRSPTCRNASAARR
jgi:hypothetical protein